MSDMELSDQQTVISHVRALGRASRMDLEPLCPGIPRPRLTKVLQQAAFAGFLRRVGVTPRESGGIRTPIYEATGKTPKRRLPRRVKGEGARSMDRPLPPRGEYGYIGKVSSVFDLGA